MAPTIKNRAVPTTESTYYAFSPGLQVAQDISSNQKVAR
jgi:hypothetical protein